MSYRSSLAQIRAKARAEAARIQTRARQATLDNQRHLERRIRALTCNGTRPLTKAQIEQLSRESARYFRMRLNKLNLPPPRPGRRHCGRPADGPRRHDQARV